MKNFPTEVRQNHSSPSTRFAGRPHMHLPLRQLSRFFGTLLRPYPPHLRLGGLSVSSYVRVPAKSKNSNFNSGNSPSRKIKIPLSFHGSVETTREHPSKKIR